MQHTGNALNSNSHTQILDHTRHSLLHASYDTGARNKQLTHTHTHTHWHDASAGGPSRERVPSIVHTLTHAADDEMQTAATNKVYIKSCGQSIASVILCSDIVARWACRNDPNINDNRCAVRVCVRPRIYFRAHPFIVHQQLNPVRKIVGHPKKKNRHQQRPIDRQRVFFFAVCEQCVALDSNKKVYRSKKGEKERRVDNRTQTKKISYNLFIHVNRKDEKLSTIISRRWLWTFCHLSILRLCIFFFYYLPVYLTKCVL